MTNSRYSGGAPILGEAVALDLANTYYAVRGKPADGLRSSSDATAWMQALADRLAAAGAPRAAEAAATAGDVDRLLELRTAVRNIASALLSGERVTDGDVASLNRMSASSPRWESLSLGANGGPTRVTKTDAAPVDQVLGALAGDAIDLFTGPHAAEVRLCQRPGCPLFFLKDHPRREWCTPACGARVRAARAYQKRTTGHDLAVHLMP
jgi:predicted RNA-binding Zn ribbon-like protein